MRDVTIRSGEIHVDERPDPVPGRGEVVMRVATAGLNGADMLQLRGAYPAPPGSPAPTREPRSPHPVTSDPNGLHPALRSLYPLN